MKAVLKPLFALMSIFCVACGSAGSSGGGATANGPSASQSPGVFQNWNLDIPTADAQAIQEMATQDGVSATQGYHLSVATGKESNYQDIVNNHRLNLSGLSYGENLISSRRGTKTISAGMAYSTCEVRYDFIIAIYQSGQLRIINRYVGQCMLGSNNFTEERLYYTQVVSSDGRFTVCAYDDAAYTLQRGCINSN